MAKARAALLMCALVATAATAGPAAPDIIEPDRIDWLQPLGHDRIEVQWLLGGQDQPGNYLLRVRLDHDARIAPHVHPDARHTTVLSGSLWVGFGEQFDPDAMQRLDIGDIYVAPAGVPHYLWARDEAVLYQESGHGPSGMRFLEKSGD